MPVPDAVPAGAPTTPDPSPERWLPFEGCFNFRDLGGYRGAGGRPVRWRVLFRADGLHRLTDPDRDSLRALGLRTVIDLRTRDEVTERGRVPDHDGLDYHHLPMLDVLPPDDELPRWERFEHVAAEYRRMLAEGAPTIAQVLALLADEERYPAVYHCFAGKDRTGILTALVLELLGVADDDIVADYALSQIGMQRMLTQLRARYPERAAEIDASAAAIASADPATMATFLAAFRAEHGGADAFAAALGLPGIAGRLRELLLEPA